MDLDRRLRVMFIPDKLRDDPAARETCERWGLAPIHMADRGEAINEIFERPPDAVVVDRGADPADGYEFACLLKRDYALAHIPVIMRIDEEHLDEIRAWEMMPIDDFVTDWRDTELLALRIRMSAETGTRELDANPLTRLGGNNAIHRCIADNLEAGRDFAVGYVDLDNFKAFNDTYGFARGDEVIRLMARLLTTSLQANDLAASGMVGHVGGDDFVFIIPCHGIVRMCEDLIERFDIMVRALYDDDDARRGGIRAITRAGDTEFFPFVSLSIAVAVNFEGSIEHPAQFSAILGDLKRKVKARRVSNYIVDRRHSGGFLDESPPDSANLIA